MRLDMQNVIVRGRKIEPEELATIAKWYLCGSRSEALQSDVRKLFGSRRDAVHEAVLYFYTHCSPEAMKRLSATTLMVQSTRWAVSRAAHLVQREEDRVSRYVQKVRPRHYVSPPRTHYDDIPLSDRLSPFVNRLTQQEQRAIRSRFTDGKTYREIGEEMKVSQTRVGQLLGRAIEKLSEMVTTSGQKEVLMSYLE